MLWLLDMFYVVVSDVVFLCVLVISIMLSVLVIVLLCRLVVGVWRILMCLIIVGVSVFRLNFNGVCWLLIRIWV